MSKNMLLVEGDFDKGFLQKLCNDLVGINTVEVTVLAPKDIGARKNTWRAIIDNLPILLKESELDEGAKSFEKLGIVLDADYPPDNNGGFDARYQLVAKTLSDHGYFPCTDSCGSNSGEIFTHESELLPPIGLWIMPNHRDNGMVEGFIENMIDSSNADQQLLLSHADKTVTELPVTLFKKELHTTKVKVHTWLAWQKKPGQLYTALDTGILDKSKVANFETWLKRVFQ